MYTFLKKKKKKTVKSILNDARSGRNVEGTIDRTTKTTTTTMMHNRDSLGFCFLLLSRVFFSFFFFCLVEKKMSLSSRRGIRRDWLVRKIYPSHSGETFMIL